MTHREQPNRFGETTNTSKMHACVMTETYLLFVWPVPLCCFLSGTLKYIKILMQLIKNFPQTISKARYTPLL